ncbi:MAG: hypothetical protein KC561_17305, partial [Myxococcales bacterium]|nr:hypothetical protein [Myxococcales bacterium]
HFFIDKMSHDDSPGGNHNGSRTDPLVAYCEGIATVFALMVEGNPIYVDTMTGGGLNQDYERAQLTEARGTSTGTLTGLVSENLVVAAIWDLLDESSESHDTLSLGDEAVMDVLLNYMPTYEAQNQGVAGADLADFIYGFRQMHPSDSDAIDRLLTQYAYPAGVAMASPDGGKGKTP